MYNLFQQCMTEARENGKLKRDILPEDAVQFMFTTFYGAFLTSQLYAAGDVMPFYETHLKLIENTR